MVGLRALGLAAAIYTQTTDVEGEVNGLMTYDRELVKFDEDRLNALHDRIYASEGVARVLLPTSEYRPQEWEYRMSAPEGDWTDSGSADGWQVGAAPFQSGSNSNLPTGTVWESGPIWIRATFDLEAVPANLWVELYHAVDSGAVYLNGQQILDFEGLRLGGQRHYRHMDMSAHVGLLRKGRNTLAVTGEYAEAQRGLDFGAYTVD